MVDFYILLVPAVLAALAGDMSMVLANRLIQSIQRCLDLEDPFITVQMDDLQCRQITVMRKGLTSNTAAQE